MSDKVVTLTLSPEFASFLESVHQQHKIDSNVFNEPILALDPGETTGWAIFDGDVSIMVSQEPTKSVVDGANWLRERIEVGYTPTYTFNQPEKYLPYQHIRCEDYRVYEWKASDHSWSPVHTLRWIGAIELIADDAGIDLSFCMAQHAKGFWSDAKLKHFGLYPVGLKHGKDALRHLLYYLLFPTKAG